MNKIAPEVLIYIQNIKNYLTVDIEARQYFMGESNEEFFFNHLTEISQKNFESNGEAMLSREQFELLRKTLIAVIISKKDIPEDPMDKIFLDIEGFGKFCLN
jgi:hypothetical protein